MEGELEPLLPASHPEEALAAFVQHLDFKFVLRQIQFLRRDFKCFVDVICDYFNTGSIFSHDFDDLKVFPTGSILPRSLPGPVASDIPEGYRASWT